MESLKEFFREDGTKKFLAMLLLVALLFSLKKMISLFLLTFIFGYILYSLQRFVFDRIKKIIPVKMVGMTFFTYGALLFGIGFVGYKVVQLVSKQVAIVGGELSSFQIDSLSGKISPQIISMIKQAGVEQYLKDGGVGLMHAVTNIGEFSLQLFLALFLSFFFLLEKDRLVTFGRKLEGSSISYLYCYYKKVGQKFLRSFGKILQLQVLVSFIDAVISAVVLAIIGFHDVLGLGFMMFILGLVPVAGVIISLIPLCIIAFSIGGVAKVVAVVIMVLAIHALETYVLSPKLMALETKLPIFITFMTLILSEHFFGVWGLLVGIPLLVFILDAVHVGRGDEKVSK